MSYRLILLESVAYCVNYNELALFCYKTVATEVNEKNFDGAV
jgi:hypothetical protein